MKHVQAISRDKVLEKAWIRTFYSKNVHYTAWQYKADKAVRNQLDFSAVACEQNSRGLKSDVVKMYLTVVSAYENKSR